jgi:hypothetical protein
MSKTIQALTWDSYSPLPRSSRVAALHAATEEGLPTHCDFCVEALKKETYFLAKWYLIKLAGQLGCLSAIPAIIEVGFKPDVDAHQSSLHRIAAWSLGKMGGAATETLFETLQKAQTEEQVVFAIDSLGETRDSRCGATLRAAFETGTYEAKLWTALSLAKLGEYGRGILEGLLDKSDSDTDRLLILDALVKIDRQTGR